MNTKRYIDHEGNEFSSIEAMCEYWNITTFTYINRTRRGWSIEKALTIPVGSINGKSKSATDHEGNKFPSIAAMCRHWNVPYSAYNNRIRLGWSLKDVLTMPAKLNSKSIIDHEGNEFPSITAMCKYWGVTKYAYDKRIEYGWSLKDVLTQQGKKSPTFKEYSQSSIIQEKKEDVNAKYDDNIKQRNDITLQEIAQNEGDRKTIAKAAIKRYNEILSNFKELERIKLVERCKKMLEFKNFLTKNVPTAESKLKEVANLKNGMFIVSFHPDSDCIFIDIDIDKSHYIEILCENRIIRGVMGFNEKSPTKITINGEKVGVVLCPYYIELSNMVYHHNLSTFSNIHTDGMQIKTKVFGKYSGAAYGREMTFYDENYDFEIFKELTPEVFKNIIETFDDFEKSFYAKLAKITSLSEKENIENEIKEHEKIIEEYKEKLKTYDNENH